MPDPAAAIDARASCAVDRNIAPLTNTGDQISPSGDLSSTPDVFRTDLPRPQWSPRVHRLLAVSCLSRCGSARRDGACSRHL